MINLYSTFIHLLSSWKYSVRTTKLNLKTMFSRFTCFISLRAFLIILDKAPDYQSSFWAQFWSAKSHQNSLDSIKKSARILLSPLFCNFFLLLGYQISSLLFSFKENFLVSVKRQLFLMNQVFVLLNVKCHLPLGEKPMKKKCKIVL